MDNNKICTPISKISSREISSHNFSKVSHLICYLNIPNNRDNLICDILYFLNINYYIY